MVDIEFIKLRARDGWSIRETARHLLCSCWHLRKSAGPYSSGHPLIGPWCVAVRWLPVGGTAVRARKESAKYTGMYSLSYDLW